MFRSEREFVRWLQTRVEGRAQGVKLGVGDDAAVVAFSRGQHLVLKADMTIEGIHFTRRLHPAASVGHRALARALSDIAAVGGTPRFALVSLALSRRAPRPWLAEFYAGMSGLGRRWGVPVIGGDTALVTSSSLIDVTVAGEVPAGQQLARDGARPGDLLFVSGRLGLSALGLRLLRSGRSRGGGSVRLAVRAHLYPEPRLHLGRFLAARRLASALIDVSDGLSTDLGHLCEASGVGARVWADRIPGPDAGRSAAVSIRESLALALHGGEDYELLFTVPRAKASSIPRQLRGVPLRQVGAITRSRKVVVMDKDGRASALEPRGYDHFRERRQA